MTQTNGKVGRTGRPKLMPTVRQEREIIKTVKTRAMAGDMNAATALSNFLLLNELRAQRQGAAA